MTTPLGPLQGNTPNYNFNLVNFDWITWHDYEHDNWTLADALFYTLLGVQNVKGVWQPSTSMVAGERWVDETDATMWECLVDHTSGGGTFQEDRIANPSYWAQVNIENAYDGAMYLPGSAPASPGSILLSFVAPRGFRIDRDNLDGGASASVGPDGDYTVALQVLNPAENVVGNVVLTAGATSGGWVGNGSGIFNVNRGDLVQIKVSSFTGSTPPVDLSVSYSAVL